MATELVPQIDKNAAFLTLELDWLYRLIELRLRLYFDHEPPAEAFTDIMPPALNQHSSYSDFVLTNKLGTAERMILILSLAPHLKPELLDAFYTRNTTYDKKFTEFGGIVTSTGGFIPTIQTALFLWAGSDLKLRFQCYEFLGAEQTLVKLRVINLINENRFEPVSNSMLQMTSDYTEYFISGQWKTPGHNENFPAKQITTQLTWDDVIHSEASKEGIEEIKDWVEKSNTVLKLKGLQKRLKPGYKTLFYGPPGTGKTLTAALLGKMTGHDVYRIDLSLITSRYIGETEKNLSKVFDQAENRDWILFFDEADALFGKRTDINSSNDRFANQEVAYLLQRIEDHNGVVILASNLKDNIDKAFLRRFQSVIYFPVPGIQERYLLWKESFPGDMMPAKDVDLYALSEKYTIAGGSIVNVVRYCCLMAVKNKQKDISMQLIETGIKKELQKEGILF